MQLNRHIYLFYFREGRTIYIEKELPQSKLYRHHGLAQSLVSCNLIYTPDSPTFKNQLYRSEERRVGKECRSRWSPDPQKKKRGSQPNTKSTTSRPTRQ